MPLGILRRSEPGYGTLSTFLEAGALTLTAVIAIVNFQVGCYCAFEVIVFNDIFYRCFLFNTVGTL